MNESNLGLQTLIGETEREGTEEELTAAIYARTSSSSKQFGYSIDGQVRKCWRRCQQLDWTVSHVFCDEDISGKDPDRPMFQMLLEQAEYGDIDVIVFWKLDRFSRSLMHAVKLEEQLRNWGVGLHSITELIDTTTPTGRFNFRNISSASEFERDLIRQRTRMGMNELAMDHKWPNDHPPFGYSKCADGTLEIIDSEAEVVRMIFRRYKKLKSMPELAEKLNKEGISTKKGGEWNARGVGDILKNELYVGKYSIAEVEDHVPEYQLLEQQLFEEVTEVRTRFQRKDRSSRGEMTASRKRARVMDVVDQFHEFLEHAESTD